MFAAKVEIVVSVLTKIILGSRGHWELLKISKIYYFFAIIVEMFGLLV